MEPWISRSCCEERRKKKKIFIIASENVFRCRCYHRNVLRDWIDGSICSLHEYPILSSLSIGNSIHFCWYLFRCSVFKIHLILWFWILLGQDSGCICQDDSARFEKTSARWVLSILGRLFTEAKVELKAQATNAMLLCFSKIHSRI